MECPMLEKGQSERDDHDCAEKKNPIVRMLPEKNGKSGNQTGDGDRFGKSLQPGHIWSAERPGQSCEISVEYAERRSAAYLQIPNIDKVKRNKIDERGRVARRRPTDDCWN